MTAKEYLGQIRKYDILIENKTKMIQRLREQAESVTVAMGGERVKSSGSNDKLGDTIVKILDLENTIKKDVESMARVKQDVMNTIDKIGDADLMNVLYKRYVHFKTWEEIPEEMGYTERTIYRLHGKALLALQKHIPESCQSKSVIVS